jgi:signal transduction histidine kinase
MGRRIGMTMETRNFPPVLEVSHEVLSVVSHELRGPLGVARGYLRLLAQGSQLDPRATKMVADIQRATDRMSTLLDEVSEYARWVRGEHTVNLAPLPLHEIVAAAAADAVLPDSVQVRVEVDAPHDIVARADRAPLIKAWAALVSATARAQVEDATIAVILRSADPGHAVLRIAPHSAIDATDEHPVVIERAGAGLSLALAQLIVQRHGGTMTECRRDGAWAGYRCSL